MTEKLISRITHVIRREATYYFRMRVPADLETHYKKKEISFSLKTKDQAEEKQKGHVEALRYLDEFKTIRSADTSFLESLRDSKKLANCSQVRLRSELAVVRKLLEQAYSV